MKAFMQRLIACLVMLLVIVGIFPQLSATAATLSSHASFSIEHKEISITFFNKDYKIETVRKTPRSSRKGKLAPYYQTTQAAVPIYFYENNQFTTVGKLVANQSFRRVRDYGNYHEIKFGSKTAYVPKQGTEPAVHLNLEAAPSTYTPNAVSFTPVKDVPVYKKKDGKSGQLAQIRKGIRFTAIKDEGDWYKINLSGRIGYVFKSDVNSSDHIPTSLKIDNRAIKQALIVDTTSLSSPKAILNTYEKSNGIWKKVHSQIPVIGGKNGFAADKIEGDGKTPLGVFGLGYAFGWGSPPTHLNIPFRAVTTNDYWIDDPSSADYNQWIRYTGDPAKRWQSFERLHHPLYKYAIHIRYNENPIVKGKGSAIFLHVWRNSNTPTLGCIAMEESSLLKVIKWLNESKQPIIAITR